MQVDKGWRAQLALGLCTAVAGLAGAAQAATLPGPASEIISLNCGGATISLTQGDQAISLTCGAATLSVPARGKAMAAPASAPVAPIRSSTTVVSAPQAAVPAVARVPSAQDAPIITLASADVTPPAPDAAKPAATKPDPAKPDPTKPDAGSGLSASQFYAGAGFAISQNVGSTRASDVKLVTRSDGQVLAQVQNSEDQNVSAMFETHYLLQGQGVFGNTKWYDNIARIAACGPFAFVSNDATDTNRTGCGPLFTAIIDTDGKVSQFGIGWALGLGKQDTKADPNAPARSSFGIGVGLLFNPDGKVLDTRIVDPATKLVRPEFKDSVLAGTTPTLVGRQTTSAFVMVSKTF